jgi:dienelactone hydrolase
VAIREVEEPSLSASLYVEEGPPRPGVIVLGGAEGGRPRYLARLLASEGFSCLALSYFGAEPLPRRLVEVPIDCVEIALDWLRERSDSLDIPIGLVGVSKGAELALLAASKWPDAVGAVVAYAPSAVTFAGISPRAAERRRSSWSYQGVPLPFVPFPPRARPALCPQGVSFAPMYEAGLDNPAAVAAAAVPVEAIRAPVILISGGRDRMWPSSRMVGMVKSRLAEHGSPEVVHLEFPEAGHSIMPWAPGIAMNRVGRFANGIRLSGTGGLFALGGKPWANRAALREAWPQAVAFLRTHLR